MLVDNVAGGAATFKAIGAKSTGRPGAAASAPAKVTAELWRIAAFEDGVVLRNGSGLFDANRATPASTVALLRAMYRNPFAGAEFVAQLSVGGVDGTLRHRFRGWASTRVIRAKTGTLHGIAALSGYVIRPGGRWAIAFSAFVNGVGRNTAEAHSTIDGVVDAIGRETLRPVDGRSSTRPD